MLKKGQMVKFTRPMSSMRLVLMSVENGNCTIRSIMDSTRLKKGQVTSAIYNLRFIGAIIYGKDDCGRITYLSPHHICGVAQCLKGVRSIFDVPLPTLTIDPSLPLSD